MVLRDVILNIKKNNKKKKDKNNDISLTKTNVSKCKR